MPTYDYQCRSCGAITEVIHSMLDPGPSACDRCGGELRRVLYPAGIIFKGSGFYRTDSRNGSGSATTKKPGEAAGSGTSESGTSESGASKSAPSSDSTSSPSSAATSSEKTAKQD